MMRYDPLENSCHSLVVLAKEVARHAKSFGHHPHFQP